MAAQVAAAIARPITWVWSSLIYPAITSNKRKVELKEKLQKCYKDAALEHHVWEEERLLIENYYQTLDLELYGKAITIDTIFENPSKRIVVEGQSGMGKTTLITKLAYDWANEKKYLEKFDLVFAIRLNAVEGDDISSALFEVADNCGFRYTAELPVELIEGCGKTALILIDGYDDLRSEKLRRSVNEVFCGQKFSKATVVITCRSGMHRSNEPNCSQKVTIVGMSKENIKKLLAQFNAEGLANTFDNMTSELKEICKSPLIVMLFGHLKDIMETVDFKATTVTALHRQIFNGLVKRYHDKKDVTLEYDFDLFENLSSKCELSGEKLIEFCKCCYDFIRESRNHFEYSPICQDMYNFGFLKKVETKKGSDKKVHFESFHRSFVEFFAAFYIMQECNQPLNEGVDAMLATLHDIFYQTRGTSLILPFVGGLMGKNAHLLFQNLTPNAQIYSRMPCELKRIVRECELNNEVTDALVPFFACGLSLGRYSLFEPTLKDFNRDVLQRSIDKMQPAILVIDTKTWPSIDLSNKKFEEICIRFDRDCITRLNTDKLVSLSCKKLIFSFGKFNLRARKSSDENYANNTDGKMISLLENSVEFHVYERFNSEFTNDCESILNDWFNIANTIQSEVIEFILPLTSIRNTILRFIDKWLDHQKKTNCSVSVTGSCLPRSKDREESFREKSADDLECFEILQRMLSGNKLNGLTMSPFLLCGKVEELSRTINTALKSDALTSFQFSVQDIYHEPVTVSTENLILREQISPTGCRMSFNGLHLVDNTTQKDLGVSHLEIMNCKYSSSFVERVSNSAIDSLKCDTDFLHRILSYLSNNGRSIANTLTELSIHLIPETEHDVWQDLPKLQRISKLTINFTWPIFVLSKDVERIRSMHIPEIHLLGGIENNPYKDYFEKLISMFDILLRLNEDEIQPIKSITFYFEFVSKINGSVIDKKIADVALDWLDRGVQEVVLFWDDEQIAPSLSMNWMDLTKFNVEIVPDLKPRFMLRDFYRNDCFIHGVKITRKLQIFTTTFDVRK